ncbi:hypothetical protein DSAG12_03112 [Promethearchaeum syntrophicum]|uniref:Uncharacterized protein n=1 Tax=Promethearchaeum syntrophicum TaxID=2594042 RepID=A0A5B9DES4_9ARCH|nr:hypothetical protein [Candidatus Prometheoarchaeum syntrophicum]QEE17280.1 hypothetical protein DSAG12_03112 [Candidatus Prometheoarchaeum syntrophicum]
MKNKQLYKISKYAYKEAFLESQLEMAGVNQAQILEKMEKNAKYMRTQDIAMKIVVMIYLASMVILPVQVFGLLNNTIGRGIPAQWAIFAGGISFSIFFAIQLMFLLTFGVYISSGFFSGEEFKWLSTLPLSKKELHKVTLFTFFRTVDAQFFALTLGFPIATFFATKNILITFISLIVSLLNMVFSIGILAVLGEKLHRIMKNSDVTSKKASLIRVSVMVGYAVLTIGIALSFNLIVPKIEPFFLNYPTNLDPYEFVNKFIGIIPYPFSGGFLISNLYINSQDVPFAQYFTPILGIILLIIINLRFYRTVMKKMNNLIFKKTGRLQDEEKLKITEIKDIKLITVKPMNAFFKRDKKMASRDVQVIMMIVMPILLPFVSFASLAIGAEEIGKDFDMVIMLMNLSYWMMSGVIIIVTLLNIESSGATITQALPINPRDQAIAKIKWLLIILPISSFISLVPFIGKEAFVKNFIYILITMSLGPLTGILTLLLRVRFFGKLKNKYVMGEINLGAKIWKWVLIVIVDIILYIVIAAGFGIILLTYNLAILSLVFIVGEVVILFILSFFFNRMFPKKQVQKI